MYFSLSCFIQFSNLHHCSMACNGYAKFKQTELISSNNFIYPMSHKRSLARISGNPLGLQSCNREPQKTTPSSFRFCEVDFLMKTQIINICISTYVIVPLQLHTIDDGVVPSYLSCHNSLQNESKGATLQRLAGDSSSFERNLASSQPFDYFMELS